VQVTGELKNVQIRLVSNPIVWQTIDIIVVDIPEAYGLLLSRDWSMELNGYFATYWSHLWLPHKGIENQIRVDREPYMKYTVTKLEAPNKPLMFPKGSHENYCFDSFFGDFPTQIAPEENRLSEENMACSEDKCDDKILETKEKKPSNLSNSWVLYLDGSKCKEGAGAGCILTDPEGTKTW